MPKWCNQKKTWKSNLNTELWIDTTVFWTPNEPPNEPPIEPPMNHLPTVVLCRYQQRLNSSLSSPRARRFAQFEMWLTAQRSAFPAFLTCLPVVVWYVFEFPARGDFRVIASDLYHLLPLISRLICTKDWFSPGFWKVFVLRLTEKTAAVPDQHLPLLSRSVGGVAQIDNDCSCRHRLGCEAS